MSPAAGKSSPPSKTRILLVDDHYFVRMGLTVPLNNEPDLEVIAEAQSGREAIERFHETKPDVVILDGRLPDMSGIDVLERIRTEVADARIIMLSVDETEEDVFRAMEGGARAYLGKSAPWDQLLHAVREVAQGRKWLPEPLAAKLRARRTRRLLSPREMEILQQVGKGLPNKQIADVLGISELTVKVHITNIFDKLQVSDRVSAVAVAVQRGLVRME